MVTYETTEATSGDLGSSSPATTAVSAASSQPQAQGSVAIRLTRIRFGEFLCQRNLISEEQLLEALGDHWSNGGNIGSAVHRQGFLDRDEIERQADAYHSLDTVEV